jgi:hypothetical protein
MVAPGHFYIHLSTESGNESETNKWVGGGGTVEADRKKINRGSIPLPRSVVGFSCVDTDRT